MQACRYGHWEVVQTLLLFRCNVSSVNFFSSVFHDASLILRITSVWSIQYQVMRADYLSGRTALHFAAMNGHVRCIRLVVADFVPSAPYDVIHARSDAEQGGGSNVKGKNEQRYIFPFHYVICNYILLPT